MEKFTKNKNKKPKTQKKKVGLENLKISSTAKWKATTWKENGKGNGGAEVAQQFSTRFPPAASQENHKILTNLLKVYTLLLDFTGPMGPESESGLRSGAPAQGPESVKSTIERQRFSHLDIKEIYGQTYTWDGSQESTMEYLGFWWVKKCWHTFRRKIGKVYIYIFLKINI